LLRYYEADYALVQLAVSGYLAFTGLLQLIIGPLSDRYGRRPVLLIGSLDHLSRCDRVDPACP
jgi:DHA1 family bicyclomycin/chloramphenicol resistance-like MFS transporter